MIIYRNYRTNWFNKIAVKTFEYTENLASLNKQEK